MSKPRVIVDVETVGCDWASLADEEVTYLVGRARGDDEKARAVVAREALGLSGLTGSAVLVGMLNPDTGKGRLHLWPAADAPDGAVIAAGERVRERTDGRIGVVLASDETMLLRAFWDDLAQYEQVISFNGRGFDGPFLVHRSVALGVSMTHDLVPNRYSDSHIDLMDRLSCYGATSRYTLDFWCRRLGIPSPKAMGMSGGDVERLWREGRLAELCTYNVGDLCATAALFGKYIAAYGTIQRIPPVADPGAASTAAISLCEVS